MQVLSQALGNIGLELVSILSDDPRAAQARAVPG